MSEPRTDANTLLRHADFVRRLARSLVLDEHRADDLAQDAWVAALSSPAEPRRPRAWLAGITRNLARMTFRSAARRRRHETARPPSGEAPSAAAVAARMEEQERLVRAVVELGEPSRTAVVLRWLDGLPPREIAERLGVPVRTVESRLRRGLETLRERLDRAHGGDGKSWKLAVLPLVLARPEGAPAPVALATSFGCLAAVVGLVSGVLLLLVLLGVGPLRRAAPDRPETTRPGRPEPERSVAARPPDDPLSGGETGRPAAPGPETEPGREPAVPAGEKPDRPRPARPPDSLRWPAIDVDPGDVQAPPGMALVEGGTFVMGSPERGVKRMLGASRAWLLPYLEIEVPEHEVEIGSFYLDRFEVTNAQYLAYLDAAQLDTFTVEGALRSLDAIARHVYTEADADWWRALYHQNEAAINPQKKDLRPDGTPDPEWAHAELRPGLELRIHRLPIPTQWLEWLRLGVRHPGEPDRICWPYPDDLDDHPVAGVSLVHARKFAAWAGKHVPFEDEWEHAARGPDAFIRPWGGTWSRDDWKDEEDRLNWCDLPPDHPARNANPNVLTTPVGSFPDGTSPYGMFDMVGNVWEWTESPLVAYEGSPAGPQDWWREVMVVRGGSYIDTYPEFLRSSFRSGGDGVDIVTKPDAAFRAVGFRCASWLVPGADRAFCTFLSMDEAGTLPAGVAFDLRAGIGVERRVEDRSAHPVYVQTASRSIAILPRSSLPPTVETVRDLDVAAREDGTRVGVVVGLLHSDAALEVHAPREDGTEEEATAEPGDFVLSYHDGRLLLLLPRVRGDERVGYLSSKRQREKLADVRPLDSQRAEIRDGSGRVDITFSSGKEPGRRDRFVFRAQIHTAAPDAVRSTTWIDTGR